MGSIAGFSSSILQSVLGAASQGIGGASQAAGSVAGTSSAARFSDNQQLSPFAQLVSSLQQLQQSDPAKYKQVTQQIATNLQGAAQTAQSQGNTTAANQLTQLASDFTSASQTGQLPSIQDLAKIAGGSAVGGHHGHHHHAHAASSDSDGDGDSSSASPGSASGTSQNTNPLLANLQTAGTQNAALDPAAIILATLSNAGITVSNG